MLPDEELLGLVWSYLIRYQNSGGYALAITTHRIIGARKSAWSSGFDEYLGPESRATEEDRQKAKNIFPEIVANKDLEISKDSVIKMSWKKAGYFHGARFLFVTKQGDFQIVTSPLRVTLAVAHAINQIVASLAAFGPDRFYEEKTGLLVMEEATKDHERRRKR
jgi:hypothetical protein